MLVCKWILHRKKAFGYIGQLDHVHSSCGQCEKRPLVILGLCWSSWAFSRSCQENWGAVKRFSCQGQNSWNFPSMKINKSFVFMLWLIEEPRSDSKFSRWELGDVAESRLTMSFQLELSTTLALHAEDNELITRALTSSLLVSKWTLSLDYFVLSNIDM